MSVALLFYLQTHYELLLVFANLHCADCVFVVYALNRVFAKGSVKYLVWTCRVPISLILGS